MTLQNKIVNQAAVCVLASLLHIGFVALLYKAMTSGITWAVAYSALWIGYAVVVRYSPVKAVAHSFTSHKAYWVYSVLFHLLLIAEVVIAGIALSAKLSLGLQLGISLIVGYGLNPMLSFGARSEPHKPTGM